MRQVLVPTAAGEPSAYKLVPDAERHLLLTAETHNFPTGVAPFEGAATVRSLIPLACALNIVPPKSTFTEPFSSPLCTFPHTGHWRPHSRCAGHRPWCSCGRGHRRLLRRQPPHSRLRHALGGCGASLAHCRTRRTRTGTARGGARSFPLPFFSELGLPQQLCSPPANRSEPAHKRLFAPVPRRASSCSNPTFFSPAQIDASNGASDYGNKFGEPVITGMLTQSSANCTLSISFSRSLSPPSSFSPPHYSRVYTLIWHQAAVGRAPRVDQAHHVQRRHWQPRCQPH